MNDILNCKVIILANALGGTEDYSSRWGNHLGITKHLVPIGKMPLIHYTQKQLKLYGFTDINISCQKKDRDLYIINNNNWINPPDTSAEGAPNNEIIISKSLFSREKNNIILFGDNFYSDSFFEKIIDANTERILIYARTNPSEYVNKKHWEPFGWYVPNNEIDYLIKCAEGAVKEMLSVHNRVLPDSAIWQTYSRVGTGKQIYDSSYNWVEIDDETTDFDYPKDWDFWSTNVLPNIKLNENIINE